MALTFAFLVDGREVRLPVAPKSYRWGAAQEVQTVEMDTVGTVFLPGLPGAHSDSIEVLLPAQQYPFCAGGAVIDPQYYIDLFCGLAKQGKVVRYIVGERVNAPVLIEEFTFQEQDGTRDVYATIYLKEYIAPEAASRETTAVNSRTGNLGRSEATEGTTQYYTVQKGDCLSVICRRFYGNGTAKYYNAVAKVNGIKNPHLIYAGQKLALPPKAQLGVE